MQLCACPAATALTTIPAATCAESFGQIQKVAFMRLKKADGTVNSFVDGSGTGIDKKAAWTAKMALTDGGKAVISPYIQAPTQDGGDARTFGGGNETLGGVEIVIGRNPMNFSGVMRGVPQSIIKVMKSLQCEAQGDNLGVILFDENGNIEAIKKVTTGTPDVVEYMPIPIRSLFIGDKVHGGLEAPDNNAISWKFLPNYSDDLAIVQPDDFNPLTDLVPAT
ncbi:MAG: hypothetical protein IIW65_02980 [Alistipes sp.]|nr:hypothetical protein [Alistipes sp.]